MQFSSMQTGLNMRVAASAGRHRWIPGTIALDVGDHVVTLHGVNAVRHRAGKAARMGVLRLENGDKAAWGRFDGKSPGGPDCREGEAP